jgi:uncharacterized protein YuzE
MSTMTPKRPRRIELDLEAGAGYVRYEPDDVSVVGTIDVWREGRVAVDVDASGSPIGIEVLGFDAATLSRARSYASEHGLAFPPIELLARS